MRTAHRIAIAIACVALASSRTYANDVLFEDNFERGLSAKWSVVGLKKSDYRAGDGCLEMRVQSGAWTNKTPHIRVVLPFTTAETVTVSVKVTPMNKFTNEGEFAGVGLLDETGTEFTVKKQLVGDKLVYAPGNYIFEGKDGEEGDPGKYEIKYTEVSDEAGPLRIISDRGYGYFQVGPSPKDEYLNFFHSALRKEAKERGFCLIAVGAPKDAEHWVRFEAFRVERR
jgi:hypothetical protein